MSSLATRESEKSLNRDGGGDSQSLSALVHQLQGRLVRAVHDVNNPLAIISGNAQFLGELAREGGLDQEAAKCAADLEEASMRLSESLRPLSELGEAIGAALSTMDAPVNGQERA